MVLDGMKKIKWREKKLQEFLLEFKFEILINGWRMREKTTIYRKYKIISPIIIKTFRRRPKYHKKFVYLKVSTWLKQNTLNDAKGRLKILTI